jgi:hypothetical protein
MKNRIFPVGAYDNLEGLYTYASNMECSMLPATMDNPRKRVKQACDWCRVKKIKVSTAIPNAIKPNADLRVV